MASQPIVVEDDLIHPSLTGGSLSGARGGAPGSVWQSHNLSLQRGRQVLGGRSLLPLDNIGGLVLATAKPSLTRPSVSGPSTPTLNDQRSWDMDQNPVDEMAQGHYKAMVPLDEADAPFKPSSPTFSASSSPTTPVSFNFSPIFPRLHFSGLEMRRDDNPELSGIPRQDSLVSALSDESICSPSTSYAASSPGPSSFPFHDYFGSQPEFMPFKGKGKERELPAPAETYALRPPDEIGEPLGNDEGDPLRGNNSAEMKDVDCSGALVSGSDPLDLEPKLGPSRSHIGLSFLEQRYAPTTRGHIARSRSRSRSRRGRSRSSVSLQRSPTPVPIRPRSQSHIRSVREKAAPSKQSSIRRILSIASRGRSFKRDKSQRATDKRIGSAPSLFALFQQGQPSNGPSSPNIVQTAPSPVHVAGASDAITRQSALQSSSIVAVPTFTRNSSHTVSRLHSRVPSSALGQGLEHTSEMNAIAPGYNTPASTQDLLEASRAEAGPSNYLATRAGPVPSNEQPFISGLAASRPPKLKFIGRGNTFTSQPHAEVSSTIAAGVPVAFDHYQGNSPPSAIMPLTTLQRAHPSSNLTSTSLPNLPGAFNYIPSLAPVMQVVPQPDGCGQILLDSVPPTFSPANAMARMKVDHFDRILPYELRVNVFRVLVGIHVHEYDCMVQSEDWTFGLAAGTTNPTPGKRYRPESARWTGFEKGVRELVRIGRVSREWRVISLDGQLWATTAFGRFSQVSPAFLQKLTQSIGPFMKTLDLRGFTGITSSLMMTVVNNLRSNPDQSTSGEMAWEAGEFIDDFWRDPAPYRYSLTSPRTQLTNVHLQGCSALTARSLHALLSSSPFLEVLSLKGLPLVNNAICALIGNACSTNLVKLDLSRCTSMYANGVEEMIGINPSSSFRGFAGSSRPRYPIPARRFPKLKELRLAGLKRVTGQTIFAIAWGVPNLELLDISGARTLTDDDLDVFVRWDERFDDRQVLGNQVLRNYHPHAIEPYEYVTLTSREMGYNPMSSERYRRRLTRLRHLSLSNCSLLTDAAVGNLAYSVPLLENLEMGGIGAAIRDAGLLRLFATTRWIRRVDLEDATDISDDVLHALVPPLPQVDPHVCPSSPILGRKKRDLPLYREPSPGELLEEIILSYAGNLGDAAFFALIRGCHNLRVLGIDNTRASDAVVKEFVNTSRDRQLCGAEVLAVDCHNVTRSVFLEGMGSQGNYLTRNRRGYRAWEARNLLYYDERDKKDPLSGVDALTGSAAVGDECDENRVVVKTFHSWQAVDNMTVARERRRKALLAKKALEEGGSRSSKSAGGDGSRTPRWLNWRSGGQTPVGGTDGLDLDRGCVMM